MILTVYNRAGWEKNENLRKKIVKIFAACLGLHGYWTIKKLLTEEEKKARGKIEKNKWSHSTKGKKTIIKYQQAPKYKKLRKKYYKNQTMKGETSE